MATSVKLNDEFVTRARKIAQAEHRTLPSQIEFYFKIALAAEENPDLSFHAVKEIMAAREDRETEEFSWS
jgi:predicted transcriptional regulator